MSSILLNIQLRQQEERVKIIVNQLTTPHCKNDDTEFLRLRDDQAFKDEIKQTVIELDTKMNNMMEFLTKTVASINK